nr:MAG TPA: hypothetical protein [Caudoviricetes sp.]
MITSTATRCSLSKTIPTPNSKHEKPLSLSKRKIIYYVYRIYEYVSTNIYYIYNI